MRKSRTISLGLLTTAAGGILVGCSGPAPAALSGIPSNTQIQQCVDAQGRVVPDEECEKQPHTSSDTTHGGGFHGGMFPFWIYHMGSPMPMGTVVPDAGLRNQPIPGKQTLRGSAALRAGLGRGDTGTGISRGGFGGSSRNSAVHS